MGFTPSVSSAQVLYGSIVGNVTDPSGGVVVNADVTVMNKSTGLTRQVATDQTGYFAIQNLLEGSYDLSITAPGFKPVIEKGVSVRINNVTRTNLRLEVGGVADSITVDAAATVLQTTKADVNTTLES